MKKIVSLIFLLLSVVSFSERLVINPKLYIDSGIIFINGEADAYTGTLVTKDEEGRLLSSVDYKNGRLNGKAVFYYPSGCIEYLAEFVDEKPLSITLYYTNGNRGNKHKKYFLTPIIGDRVFCIPRYVSFQ